MSPDTGATSASAGQLLKSVRERQGVHIAALAAALKVPPRKLDALERDRFDELGDPTFVRALAQAVCRVLHMDPQPVLALLPRADPGRLEQLGGSLNQPFRERPSRVEPLSVLWVQRALVLAGVVLLIAALFTYFVPANWLQSEGEPAASVLPATLPGAASAAFAASAAQAASAVPGAPVEAAAGLAAPPVPVPPAASMAQAPVPSVPPATSLLAVAPAGSGPVASQGVSPAVLGLVAIGSSWVEVRDREGRVLLSRTLRAGETAEVDARVPTRLVIGNATAVEVTHRGQPVPLGTVTASNVARLELP